MNKHFGFGYVTFIGERLKTGYDIGPIHTIKKIEENSLGTLSTIAIQCTHSEFPPNNSYENLDSEFYSVLKSTKVYSSSVPYRRANDVQKYVELLDDTMCTFNRQYG